jgi:L-ascorbate 6-phosphate lactonase
MAYLVTWLGQGGFELSDGELSILVDPYLSDLVHRVEGLERLVPPPIRPEDARADFYLITHDHLDHLDADTIAAMDKTGTLFAAPGSCLPRLVELGVPEARLRRLDRGGKMQAGRFSVEAVYARHTADSVGLVIEADGIRAYFSGDTELDAEVGRGISCDALFVCINGRWGNMGIPEAIELAARVGARLAVPHHYGMFAENDADPESFLAGLAASGGRGRPAGYRMEHGKRFELGELLASPRTGPAGA